jgi:hypothetical protein
MHGAAFGQVRQQVFCCSTVRRLTWCQVEGERAAVSIGKGVDLGVEPPRLVPIA